MIECRPLMETEGHLWYSVLRSGYEDLKGLPISFEAIGAAKEEALEWFRDNPAYGLFEDGELCASISLRMPWGPKPGPEKYPHIGWVVTRSDKKGNGYARRLMGYVEEEILQKELRTPAVTLGTAKEHPWLVDMYLSLGFEVLRTVQLPGKKHHTVYMIKRLGAKDETKSAFSK